MYFETHIYAWICQPYPLPNSFKPLFPALILLTIISPYLPFLTSYYSLLVLLSLWRFHQQSSSRFPCFSPSIVFSAKVHFSSTSHLHQVFSWLSPSPTVRCSSGEVLLEHSRWKTLFFSSSEYFPEPNGQSTCITYTKFSTIKLFDWQSFKCPIIL